MLAREPSCAASAASKDVRAENPSPVHIRRSLIQKNSRAPGAALFMKRIIAVVVLSLSVVSSVVAQTPDTSAGAQAAQPAERADGEVVDVQRIIRAFTAKETEFRRAL